MKTAFLNSIGILLLLILSASCKKNSDNNSFGDDLEFISQYQQPIVLSRDNSKVMVSPKYQGRVLTSTLNGFCGESFGWINYDLISSQIIKEGGNGYGGEDRFWLGPIGSKYTLYYNGKTISNENWYVPKAIDIGPYDVVNKTDSIVRFQKVLNLKNNIDTEFKIELTREVRVFSNAEIEKELGIEIPDNMNVVGFQSENSIKNIGDDWVLENGLIAPWSLGMFKGNSKSIAIFPFKGKLNLQTYLAELNEDRLRIFDNVVCYKTDGSFRSKIGLNKFNALPLIGNFDFKNNILTIITYSHHPNGQYLSCKETNHNNLFNGDVVNSYNNDSNNGKSTFFELESAAPAYELRTGESNNHIHRTFHFKGDLEGLNILCKELLGVNLVNVVF